MAASATLLAESRAGRGGAALPWALLVAGSVASLAANVAIAEPTLTGRVIAAWPSFALKASWETGEVQGLPRRADGAQEVSSAAPPLGRHSGPVAAAGIRVARHRVNGEVTVPYSGRGC